MSAQVGNSVSQPYAWNWAVHGGFTVICGAWGPGHVAGGILHSQRTHKVGEESKGGSALGAAPVLVTTKL